MDERSALYQVYEIAPGGAMLGALIAERETFYEALAAATATKHSRTRAIVYMGQIVWPKDLRNDSNEADN